MDANYILIVAVVLHLTFDVTHSEETPSPRSHARAHHDADWQDVCRDAIGCHLTHGDLGAPAEKPKYQKEAEVIATYFDMDRLEKAMGHFTQFLRSTSDQKDDSKYAPLRDELTAVGFIFYPQNYEDLTKMQSGQQKLFKLVKAGHCEATAFKCAGSLAKLVNPKGPDTRCGLTWGAISYARFNCTNIAKWPPGMKKVLDYNRLHCPALRAANCPDLLDRGGGTGFTRKRGPERRSGGSEMPPSLAALTADNSAAAKQEADDPKCAQLTREYSPQKMRTSHYFGELACGSLRSVFDGRTMIDVDAKPSWLHRNFGDKKAERVENWGEWVTCPPGGYVTSLTTTANEKAIQGVHMSCAPPRYGNETDEKLCNGPLTGVKVLTKDPHEGGPNYIWRFAAACKSAPTGWLYDFREGGAKADKITCPEGRVICAYRLYKTTSDGNKKEIEEVESFWNTATVSGYWERMRAEGEYVFDIQLYCCALEYPCTAGDMFVIDTGLDGDYSDAEPETVSRTFITGLDKGLSSSVGASSSSKWEAGGEGTGGYAGGALKAGITTSGAYTKTGGHNWKQDTSLTQSESTRVTMDYSYPEGLFTRYFRPLATCGVGRLLSGDKPFAVSFVNPVRCLLSEGWAYVTVVHSGAGATATFNVGINFTTPALTYVTGPPFLEYAEISAGLEKRLVGEYAIKSGAGSERRSGMMIRVEGRSGEPAAADPKIPAYLGKMQEQQIPVTIPGNGTGAVFQRVVRCSSPRKSGEYILVHSDQAKVLLLPPLWPFKDPTDEYVLVKNGKYDSWKEAGNFSYKLRVGVVWPEIEAMTFTPAAIDLDLRASLADKMAKIKDATQKNGYDWARNEQWKVWSAGAGLAKEVVVGPGEEVEVHQMVGSYKDYKIYTDHIETVVKDRSTHECRSGTGIFRCDSQNAG